MKRADEEEGAFPGSDVSSVGQQAATGRSVV